MKMNLEHNDGFTLVETMVALAIFSIGILGIWPMHTAVVKQTSLSNKYSGATSVLNQVLEGVKGGGYVNTSIGTTISTITSSIGGAYLVQTTITDLPGGTTRRVDVTACWQTIGGAPADMSSCDRTSSMTTFVSDY